MDTNVKVWDTRSRTTLTIFKGHTGQIQSVAGSINGNLVSSVDSDGNFKI